MSNQRLRFSDATWFPRNKEICLIGGSGGIGSWLSFFLSKIGFNIYLYDFDTIEPHNLGGQLFKQRHIGVLKVEAVQEIIAEYCEGKLNIFNERVTRDTPHHYFVFSAFDNMQARKDLFEVWKKSLLEIPEGIYPIFIDGRLELEQLQIFCVTPETMTRYETEYLFSDSVVQEVACTMKQTSHTAAMIGSLMTAFFTNHISNMYMQEDIREVPFYFEFVVPMNYVNTF